MSAATLESFLATAKPLSAQTPAWRLGDDALPALYLGHGAPPLLDDEVWMQQLATWAQGLPKPRAILIVSAHWENAPLAISSTTANTPLVYDFGGFDDRFYRLTYPTPDSSELAGAVATLMPNGQQLHQSPNRGLDHGAWVPLMVMYPNADIPVLQLSLPTSNPTQLIEIGRRLSPLRESGVLIIGSGFLTHGLPYLSPANWAGSSNPPGWSADFDAWAHEAIARADIDELSAYADRAPGMPYAHPTVEHLSPLFVTLGAGTDLSTPAQNVIDGWFMGLSKRSIQVA